MTEVAEAEALIARHLPRLPAQREAISACVDRVLAEDVTAERDQPPFDRVTMDGIAVAYRDFASGNRVFEIVGTEAAGARPLSISGAAQCVEVMTGSMLPPGTDTVIPVERISRRDGQAEVAASAAVSASQFVHARRSDYVAGSVLLRTGTRIGPPEMAVLASAGRGTVA